LSHWIRGSVYLSLALVVMLTGLACSSDGDKPASNPSPSSSSSSSSAPAPQSAQGKITVFAAASLTDSFNEIKQEFLKKNPRADVEFQFAGSPALRTQLEQGAKADIYASADVPNMSQALQAGLVQDAGKIFVRNSLVIITPKKNSAGITRPQDLNKSGIKLVLAAPEVPVGNYARQSFALMDKDPSYGSGFAAAVQKNVVSNESNVKQVVAKVQLGEADAGVVYGTDVTRDVQNDLNVIQIPNALNVIAEYPIALTRSPGNSPTAQAFVAYVTSPEGQAILKKYGFNTTAGG
jgi:molybdate transport system substrate-binding protein